MNGKDTWARLHESLRTGGLPLTKARRQVLKGLIAAGGPLSVAELLDGFPAQAPHRVTVYRTVERLADAGILKRLRFINEGSDRYELADSFGRHHHHAVCERCGRTEAIGGCEETIPNLRWPAGFKVLAHQLEGYGLCIRCQGAA